MDSYFDLLSVLILLSSFILVSHKRIKSYIKTFRIQSALIALTAGIMGFHSLASEGSLDILLVCAIIILLKVIYIPRLLHKTYGNVEYKVEKDFFLNIPLLIIICCALVVFTYFSVSGISSLSADHINLQVVNSFSVILIGFFFMISRKKALGQMIGFLVIENGIFVTAMFSTHGMPFIVDIGIFIDMITAILIMGIMVVQINEKFESININKLRNLKG
ncbi:MAG: hydrogenase [Eubacteriales bacterium]|nr:hydrogenase [Eubacteriales bacterium]